MYLSIVCIKQQYTFETYLMCYTNRIRFISSYIFSLFLVSHYFSLVLRDNPREVAFYKLVSTIKSYTLWDLPMFQQVVELRVQQGCILQVDNNTIVKYNMTKVLQKIHIFHIIVKLVLLSKIEEPKGNHLHSLYPWID